MSVFMVERDLKGISMDALGGAQKAAIGKAREMSASGTEIKYIRSTFAPDDGRCMCLLKLAPARPSRNSTTMPGCPITRSSRRLTLPPE